MTNRHARPDADLVQYLQEAYSLLGSEDGPQDEEACALLVGNALSEVEGQLGPVACSPKGSRVLQGLLKVASGDVLLSCLEALGGSQFVPLCCNAFGSHVAETLLESLMTQLKSNPSAEFLTELEEI
eukprot:CAMPEP_0114316644 /NCGR_PEP_ID=MMETSP0059-20121206/23362_1 /TAXON_ID=36894 /ORGANISM="Pyramimonas parkeae, Strain CCMP726" /LENGTH=126 /DNA_ID=CAMNT_0001442687 /DNA_START=162 /DNA_END=539 /DNA_ORIENTATION=+